MNPDPPEQNGSNPTQPAPLPQPAAPQPMQPMQSTAEQAVESPPAAPVSETPPQATQPPQPAPSQPEPSLPVSEPEPAPTAAPVQQATVPEAPQTPPTPDATPVPPQQPQSQDLVSQAPEAVPTPGSIPSAPQSNPALGMTAASAARQGKKKTIIMAVVVLLVVALLGAGVFFGLKMFGSSLKTTTYEGKNFTVLVPAEGYKKIESGDNISFREEAGSDSDQSEVMVRVMHVGALSGELEKKFLEELKSTLSQDRLSDLGAASGTTSDYSAEIENHEGQDEVWVRARINGSGDEKGGDFLVRAYVKNENVYLVVIAAHDSDPGMKRAADKIAHSLTAK